MRLLAVATCFVLLAGAAPTASAFTVEARPDRPDGDYENLGAMRLNQTIWRDFTVWLNCTAGEGFQRAEVAWGVDAAQGLVSTPDSLTQAIEGPVVCSEPRSFPFAHNVTLAFDRILPADQPQHWTVTYDVRVDAVGPFDQGGEFRHRIHQLYVPGLTISPVDGFESQAKPDTGFKLSFSVTNAGSAPVRVKTQVRTLGSYEAAVIDTSSPVVVDGAFGSSPIGSGTVWVSGLTQPALGRINETIVLEVEITATPLIPYGSSFFTEGRLFVMHVHVTNVPQMQATPSEDSAAPPLLAALAAMSIALVLRQRRR